MAHRKERYEYVKINSPDLVLANLKRTSIEFGNAMQDVKLQLEVYQDKHTAINEAKIIVKEIASEIRLLNSDLLKVPFKGALKAKKMTKKAIAASAKRTKRIYTKDRSIDSRKAMKNLKHNLADLRKQLHIE